MILREEYNRIVSHTDIKKKSDNRHKIFAEITQPRPLITRIMGPPKACAINVNGRNIKAAPHIWDSLRCPDYNTEGITR